MYIPLCELINIKTNVMHMKTKFKIYFPVLLLTGSLMACTGNKAEENAEAAIVDNEAIVSDDSKEADIDFIKEVAAINYEEIELGKLAQAKGSIKDVKDLGKMMEEDHSQNLAEVRGLAKDKAVNIAVKTPKEVEDKYKELNEKKGSDFDKEYCQIMVAGHEETIDKFETAFEDSNDEDLKTWIKKTLPKLRHHLEYSKACQLKCEQLVEAK